LPIEIKKIINMNIEYSSSHFSVNIQIAILLIKFLSKFTSWNIDYFKWLYERIQKKQLETIDVGFLLYLLFKLMWKMFKRN